MGIEIDLGYNYLLTSDGVCFTLHKLNLNKNTGNRDRSAIGYYTDLTQVFDKFANHRIMTSDARELSMIADMIAEIKASVIGALTLNAKDLVLDAGIEVREDKPPAPKPPKLKAPPKPERVKM